MDRMTAPGFVGWCLQFVCCSSPLLSSRSARPTALRQLRTTARVGRSRLALACMPTKLSAPTRRARLVCAFTTSQTWTSGQTPACGSTSSSMTPTAAAERPSWMPPKVRSVLDRRAGRQPQLWGGNEGEVSAFAVETGAPHCVSRTEPERRCAFHESGHVLAAVRLGIPIKFVTIADWATSASRHPFGTITSARHLAAGGGCVSPVQKPKRCFAASLAMGCDATDNRMACDYLSEH